jgi:hypothetical protein
MAEGAAIDPVHLLNAIVVVMVMATAGIVVVLAALVLPVRAVAAIAPEILDAMPLANAVSCWIGAGSRDTAPATMVFIVFPPRSNPVRERTAAAQDFRLIDAPPGWASGSSEEGRITIREQTACGWRSKARAGVLRLYGPKRAYRH